MKTLLIISLAMLAGCATALDPNYAPVVDFSNSQSPEGLFASHLQECKALAAQRVSAGKAAAIGTGIGAVLGAAVGIATSAVFGADLGTGAATGALFGGTGGATAGVDADLNQKDIIVRCLQNRGYAVLGK